MATKKRKPLLPYDEAEVKKDLEEAERLLQKERRESIARQFGLTEPSSSSTGPDEQTSSN